MVSILLIYTCNLNNCMKRKNREGKWLIRNCFYAHLKIIKEKSIYKANEL